MWIPCKQEGEKEGALSSRTPREQAFFFSGTQIWKHLHGHLLAFGGATRGGRGGGGGRRTSGCIQPEIIPRLAAESLYSTSVCNVSKS